MIELIHGSCVCGLVTFEISGPFEKFYLCHCNRCQKSTGSANAANIFGELNSITWLSGQELIKYFELPEAKFFNKGFCANCGSPVPRKAKSGDFLIIPAGSLNSDPGLIPQNNIFWDDRAVWYDAGCLANKVDGYSE
ncbi:MAG: GFA family protein [Gammaproteobacteria bacterium]|nr:GFA family protein [Gammaproteobacteria bacterium]